jgi:hypothetical protein
MGNPLEVRETGELVNVLNTGLEVGFCSFQETLFQPTIY